MSIKDVVVVTNPELGCDCIVGVFYKDDPILQKYEKDDEQYVCHYQLKLKPIVTKVKTESDSYPFEIFDSKFNIQLLDGGFQKDAPGIGNYKTRISEESLMVRYAIKYSKILKKFDYKGQKVDIVYDADFNYYYPATTNTSSALNIKTVETIADELTAFMNYNGIYFY